jgi:multidrug efflux pump
MGKVQQQFFPDSSRPEILVDLWLPEGSTVRETEALARRFEARMMRSPDLQSVTTWIGSGVPRFYLPLDQIFPQSNVSQPSCCPRTCGARAHAPEAAGLLADRVPGGARPRQAAAQRPAGAYPVQFRVVGPDGALVRQWADQAKAMLRANPKHARRQRQLERVRSRCCAWRSTRTRRARWASPARPSPRLARTILSGTTIGQYREGDKLIDIVLRQPLDERNVPSPTWQRLRAHGQRPQPCR